MGDGIDMMQPVRNFTSCLTNVIMGEEMPTLTDYSSFAGRHYETGTIHNFYAARNVQAPHTNQPYSEALLLGISGGITFGYFSFA